MEGEGAGRQEEGEGWGRGKVSLARQGREEYRFKRKEENRENGIVFTQKYKKKEDILKT